MLYDLALGRLSKATSVGTLTRAVMAFANCFVTFNLSAAARRKLESRTVLWAFQAWLRVLVIVSIVSVFTILYTSPLNDMDWWIENPVSVSGHLDVLMKMLTIRAIAVGMLRLVRCKFDQSP